MQCMNPKCSRYVSPGRRQLGYVTCRKSCGNAYRRASRYTSPELDYMTLAEIDAMYRLEKADAPITRYRRDLWYDGAPLPHQKHGRWLDPDMVPTPVTITTTITTTTTT